MKTTALLLCFGIIGTPLLSAQAIRGRVIESITHAPVSGALVELQDASTRPIAQTFTTSSGTFLIRLAHPSRVFVRFAAIGFYPQRLEPIDLKTSVVSLPDLLMVRAAIALPDLVTIGGKRQCRVSDTSATIMGQLLANARNALQVMDGTWQSHTMDFEVEEVHRVVRFPLKGPEQVMVSDTARRNLEAWPIYSLPPDSLRSAGFGWEFESADGPGRMYWGPDARVLFADWFLASHCFSLEVGKEPKGSRELHLKFEPERKSRLVDIGGEMVLDKATLSLATLSYRYRNLPDVIPDAAAGGTMTFMQLENGTWIPSEWSIWAPILGRLTHASSFWSYASTHREVVIGREERTGRVTKATVRTGNSSDFPHPTGDGARGTGSD